MVLVILLGTLIVGLLYHGVTRPIDISWGKRVDLDKNEIRQLSVLFIFLTFGLMTGASRYLPPILGNEIHNVVLIIFLNVLLPFVWYKLTCRVLNTVE